MVAMNMVAKDFIWIGGKEIGFEEECEEEEEGDVEEDDG